MSYNNRNQRNSAPPARKPYCKVCHDAGKPESDYTSHYVRSLPDRQGNTKVICPTLLNTECRYCYEFGHTSKFCPSLAARQKADERNRREEERNTRIAVKKPVVQPKQTHFGGFNALCCDSDEEEEKKPVVKEEFPALGAPSQRVNTTSYASAAAKPAPVKTQEANLPAGFKVLQKGDRIEKTEATNTKFNFRTTNWAEYTDSEDEEEDEEKVETAW